MNRPGERRVAIAGVGVTPFRARWLEKTWWELSVDAVRDCLADAGVGREVIRSAVYGIYNEFFERQFMPDVYIHTYLGLGHLPSVRVSAGGATGGAAVRAAWAEVASGLHDAVLVVGVEKCTDCYSYEAGSATPEVLRGILYSADMCYENPSGVTAAASYALPTVAHMDRWGSPTGEQMAMVSVKNHANAHNNPIAQSPRRLTVEDVLASRMICYPFRFYDNCLYSEGAAALLLVSAEKAAQLDRPVAWITGVGASTDIAYAGERPDLTEFTSTRLASDAAYAMAGVQDPARDLDVVEIHDAFTSAEILSYEAMHLCAPGDGGKLIEDGVVHMDGRLPVNPSGGLIGCGHAVGATGVMQVGEAALQVTGRAGARQVAGARKAAVQSIGGPATAWTYIFVVEGDGAQ